jgi:uncharacterized membrane protein
MAIVQVNVFQTQAPTPNTLQGTGGFISQGGTSNALQSFTLLTQLSDLTPMLKAPLANTSLAWTTGVVTVTTAAPHGFTIADVFPITIAGVTAAGYNGTFAATITGASTFTYAIASNPGTATVPGTYTPGSVAEVLSMATTFFGQGTNVGVYVIELGVGTPAEGVTALTTFIATNPNKFYLYLVPRVWDVAASFLTFVATFQGTTARTYFITTTINANFSQYTVLQKAVLTFIEAPGKPATEFSAAAMMWQMLFNNPGSVNKVGPLQFRQIFGVTPYPEPGSGSLFAAWGPAGVNWVGTGSEGGISTAIIANGKTMDTRPFNYWYSVDWAAINVKLNVANEVINGSVNGPNPLELNQDGINRVQARGASTLSSGVTFGLLLGKVIQAELDDLTFKQQLAIGAFAGQVVINAIPFVPYFTASPSDYRTGIYNGLSITMTPLRGFEHITVVIQVTDFVTP